MDRGQISKSADRYQREYSFMALNAIYKTAEMFKSVHAEFLYNELALVAEELLRRGIEPVRSDEEYDELVAKYGIPAAFQRKTA